MTVLLVTILSKHFFSAFGNFLRSIKLVRMQGYCLNVLSVVFHAVTRTCFRGIGFFLQGVRLGWMVLEMMHTRHKWHHFSGSKQLLLLLTYCGPGSIVHSESYDTASTQRSESVRVLTQLATTCGWLESNGTSTQHSESEFPLTLRV